MDKTKIEELKGKIGPAKVQTQTLIRQGITNYQCKDKTILLGYDYGKIEERVFATLDSKTVERLKKVVNDYIEHLAKINILGSKTANEIMISEFIKGLNGYENKNESEKI